MFKILFVGALLALSSLAHAQSTQGRPLSGPLFRYVAFFSQETLLTGETSLFASIGPLTSSAEGGFGTTIMRTKLAGSPVGTMPRISVSNPVTKDAALQAGKNWVQSELPAFQGRTANWLKGQAYGVSVAVFNYTQEVNIVSVDSASGYKKMAITFNATIDSFGKATYGSPKVVDPEPTLLEARYTPLRPADPLPPNWTYPDAGNLQYRVLNRRYEPLTGWRTLAMGGYYDDNGLDGSKLACLVDARNTPGCTTPYKTIRKLMDETGASYGLLHYIKRAEPLYELGPNAGEEVAVMAASVDSRTYDCAYLRNSGNVGFVLLAQGDSYFIEPQTDFTSYRLVQQAVAKVLSPTLPYSKQVAVSQLVHPTTGVKLHPDQVIISPVPGENDLWMRNDAVAMSRVIHVAPLVSELANTGIVFSGAQNSEQPQAGDRTRNYTLGNPGDNYWGWHSQGGEYSQSWSFNLNAATDVEHLLLKNAGVDDWMEVTLNGRAVWYGPSAYSISKLELTSGDTWPNNIGAYCSGTTCYQAVWKGAATNTSTTTTESSSTTTGTCPAGQDYYEGNCYGWVQYRYAACVPNSDGSTTCSNSRCGPWMVDYGGGCAQPEQQWSRKFSPYINMRPLLQAGTNTITVRSIVGGYGEGYIEIEARMCGTEMNLANSAPLGPGAPAVVNDLTPRVDDPFSGAGP